CGFHPLRVGEFGTRRGDARPHRPALGARRVAIPALVAARAARVAAGDLVGTEARGAGGIDRRSDRRMVRRAAWTRRADCQRDAEFPDPAAVVSRRADRRKLARDLCGVERARAVLLCEIRRMSRIVRNVLVHGWGILLLL